MCVLNSADDYSHIVSVLTLRNPGNLILCCGMRLNSELFNSEKPRTRDE